MEVVDCRHAQIPVPLGGFWFHLNVQVVPRSVPLPDDSHITLAKSWGVAACWDLLFLSPFPAMRAGEGSAGGGKEDDESGHGWWWVRNSGRSEDAATDGSEKLAGNLSNRPAGQDGRRFCDPISLPHAPCNGSQMNGCEVERAKSYFWPHVQGFPLGQTLEELQVSGAGAAGAMRCSQRRRRVVVDEDAWVRRYIVGGRDTLEDVVGERTGPLVTSPTRGHGMNLREPITTLRSSQRLQGQLLRNMIGRCGLSLGRIHPGSYSETARHGRHQSAQKVRPTGFLDSSPMWALEPVDDGSMGHLESPGAAVTLNSRASLHETLPSFRPFHSVVLFPHLGLAMIHESVATGQTRPLYDE
ncbi:hypothetical protein CSOJ01_00754 [Colletotrichum sojae]|uniref:Uncharacterized protein n=1 Tax=Colletotrichum sojae TaxID=2175907 RepID=A0A8H6JWY5_9PEZI|nr:hypothetical protein CSOJ01_00754 [Colletotrichum sojae]